MINRRDLLRAGAAAAAGAAIGPAACTENKGSQRLRGVATADRPASFRIRRSGERGRANRGWLDARYSFSFSRFYDPDFMGFRSLRVLNEDRIGGGGGFPMHPHRDMEIITYILDGALQHKDNLGNGSVIRPFEVQRMSAGRGIWHSEFNPAAARKTHLLQIWIVPDQRGHAPSYEQKTIPERARRGRLRLLASPNGQGGSVRIHQNAHLFSACLDGRQKVEHRLASRRHAWVQVARGNVVLNGKQLKPGDGAASTGSGLVTIEARGASEVLLFDLA